MVSNVTQLRAAFDLSVSALKYLSSKPGHEQTQALHMNLLAEDAALADQLGCTFSRKGIPDTVLPVVERAFGALFSTLVV